MADPQQQQHSINSAMLASMSNHGSDSHPSASHSVNTGGHGGEGGHHGYEQTGMGMSLRAGGDPLHDFGKATFELCDREGITIIGAHNKEGGVFSWSMTDIIGENMAPFKSLGQNSELSGGLQMEHARLGDISPNKQLNSAEGLGVGKGNQQGGH